MSDAIIGGRETMEEDLSGPLRSMFSYLKAAFMAMEPPDSVVTLARKCGGGSLKEEVQRFILENCILDAMEKSIEPEFSYVKRILKKVIASAESSHEVVYEGLYEQMAHYMSSYKENETSKGSVIRHISFLFGKDGISNPNNFSVSLHCSLNMLEGSTGCVIWQSSLFLSEFILSYPNIFYNKHCFEVGSGVGLVGIVLAKVKASEIILSDGDISSLENLKLNLQLNHLLTEVAFPQKVQTNLTSVMCKHLLWEMASETELKDFQPEVILGADVIYNPSCVPHLVRLLSLLLVRKTPFLPETRCVDVSGVQKSNGSPSYGVKRPTAYIATVIRNVETFDFFRKVAREAQLTVVDITETKKPLKLLPYLLSYDRLNVRLYKVFFSGH